MIPQLATNGAITSALTVPAALGCLLIYRTQRFIFFAFAAVFALAPYFAWRLVQSHAIAFWLAASLGVLASVCLGILLEAMLHRPARNKRLSSYGLLLLSIGCYVVLQNGLSMCFGDDIRSFRGVLPRHVFLGLPVYITNIQLVIIAVSILCVAVCYMCLYHTKLGKQAEAVAGDPQLALIVGIDVDAVHLRIAGLSCFFGGVAGLATACDVDMTPTMGMQPMMTAVVSVMIGGATFWGTIGAAVLLGMLPHIAVIWVPTQWQSAITFVVLLLFLLVRSLTTWSKRL